MIEFFLNTMEELISRKKIIISGFHRQNHITHPAAFQGAVCPIASVTVVWMPGRSKGTAASQKLATHLQEAAALPRCGGPFPGEPGHT